MPEITSRLSTALADRYRIERRLGKGGMATVYLAEDLKHDRKVAIKVLKAELPEMSVQSINGLYGSTFDGIGRRGPYATRSSSSSRSSWPVLIQ